MYNYIRDIFPVVSLWVALVELSVLGQHVYVVEESKYLTEDYYRGCIQEGDEQALFTKEAEMLNVCCKMIESFYQSAVGSRV